MGYLAAKLPATTPEASPSAHPEIPEDGPTNPEAGPDVEMRPEAGPSIPEVPEVPEAGPSANLEAPEAGPSSAQGQDVLMEDAPGAPGGDVPQGEEQLPGSWTPPLPKISFAFTKVE
ncbi:hypothetical protein T484DRAFT_1774024 [Baffinella frigidus]|nr:hypothetical protein T484DRAFT_1774024 [Cryptophyta sp. CCMP2293]